MNDFYLSRRHFLCLSGLSLAGWLAGCATNPVTGQSQLMLISEQQEIDLDKRYAPHQISTDYGATQDSRLAAYVEQTGRRMGSLSHRAQMPYSFRVVNANYINAYAFPGGSIAVTRGILLKLDNEAELGALLGHELGHVNARHTAQIMSKGVLTNALVGGVATVVGTQSALGGQLAAQLGMLGSGALLASYSRDNERQADALGMEYLVKNGYGSDGMVGLMGMLKSLSKERPSATDLLFSTHPMSDERYQSAMEMAGGEYRAAKGQPIHRDRYMDQTADLRRIRGAIEALQNGEKELGREKYPAAEDHFKAALKQVPDDYTGLLLMAKSRLAQEKFADADPYLTQAINVYPEEAQARYLGGLAKIKQKQFDAAISQFDTYDRQLPGNPATQFLRGYAYEGLGSRKPASENYYRYLQAVNQGRNAEYAYKRLVEWGYIKPQK
jgi:beta-barrel assembly-enhancing protease